MMPMEIVIANLGVRLGGRPVLSDLNLVAPAGRVTIVVGPNGAGKTTLLRAILGLVAAEGSITVGAASVQAMNRIARARRMAYLPQNGTVTWPLPVRDVVALGRLPHAEAPDRLRPEGARAVSEAIHAVGLEAFEERPVTELSGGERARALLARTLATQAPVLLADEPVAALDPRHQLIVLDILKRRAVEGTTVLAVMHDLALAARFADRLVLLDGGRIVAEGAPAEVLTTSRLEQVFGIEAELSQQETGLVINARRALAMDRSQPSA